MVPNSKTRIYDSIDRKLCDLQRNMQTIRALTSMCLVVVCYLKIYPHLPGFRHKHLNINHPIVPVPVAQTWDIQYIPRNMHTVLLCFALLWLCNRSWLIHMKYLSIFIRVALLALGQSCQWSKPDGYGKISQCITTTKHSKAKTVCIFLGIYCICNFITWISWS